MQTFAKALQHHLGVYKTSRLGVKEAGTYVHRGRELHYAHILPKDLKWLNILEPFRAEVRQFVESRPDVKLHKYFHHLNSSQAFALNLFFPFFEQGQSAALLQAMGLNGTASSWQPEFVVDDVEGTNVDVSWQSPRGAWSHCEVKLSEQEFGSAKDDSRHRNKLESIYGPVLSKCCPAKLLRPTTFFANYQVLRNLWLAARDPDASVVFLLPRANQALWKQLTPVLNSVSAAVAKRVFAVAIEDVLTELPRSEFLPPRLAWYAELLVEKYIPTSTGT